MSVTVNPDQGPELQLPQGQAIGYVDTQAQLDAIVAVLKADGYQESQLLLLKGKEGLALLHQEDRKFFFGDGEDAMLGHAEQELADGHFLLSIDVEGRDEALRIFQLTEPLGARRFSYFGTWINEEFKS